eukprot:TRINITY_DN67318_c0_g1_i1.p1 TRINITY_DN67318_c0_g1~~TRINITY_DN67318_c0_g1_i1.p1  ORF type:complete len:986 (+),score=180.94 TRINITY_DN67318_c0_g1_i1:94-3051(+)
MTGPSSAQRGGLLISPRFANRFVGSKHIQAVASDAIHWLLHEHPGTDVSAIAVSATRALLDALENSASKADAQHILCDALAALLVDGKGPESPVPSATAETAGPSGVELLVRSCRRHIDDATVVAATGCALARLLRVGKDQAPSLAAVAASAGAVDILVHALLRHPSVAAVQAECSAALGKILEGDVSSAVVAVQLRLADLLAEALRRHPTDGAVQSAVGGTFAALVTHTHAAGLESAVEVGTARLLTEALGRHPGCATAQADACRGLAAVMRLSAASAEQAFRADASQLLIRALEMYADDESVQTSASDALSWLVLQHPLSVEIVAFSEGGHAMRLLAVALNRFPASRSLQEGASRAFAILFRANSSGLLPRASHPVIDHDPALLVVLDDAREKAARKAAAAAKVKLTRGGPQDAVALAEAVVAADEDAVCAVGSAVISWRQSLDDDIAEEEEEEEAGEGECVEERRGDEKDVNANAREGHDRPSSSITIARSLRQHSPLEDDVGFAVAGEAIARGIAPERAGELTISLIKDARLTADIAARAAGLAAGRTAFAQGKLDAKEALNVAALAVRDAKGPPEILARLIGELASGLPDIRDKPSEEVAAFVAPSIATVDEDDEIVAAAVAVVTAASTAAMAEQLVAEARVTGLFVEALRRFRGEAGVQEQMAYALSVMLQASPKASPGAAAEAGALAVLDAEVRRWSGVPNELVYGNLVCALAWLIRVHPPSLIEAIAARPHGASELLSSALALRPTIVEADVHHPAAAALAVLRVEVVRLESHDVERAVAAVVDLWQLYRDHFDAAVESIAVGVAAEAVLLAVRAHPCALDVQSAAGVALQLLLPAELPTTSSEAVIEVLVGVLRANSDDCSVQAATSGVLGRLWRIGGRAVGPAGAVEAAAAVEALVAGLRRHAENEEVQWQASNALACLLDCQSHSIVAAVSAGSVRVLEAALDRHPRSGRLRTVAHKALRLLVSRAPPPTSLAG